MSIRWIEAWLGTPRLQKYLDAAAGDHQRALDLYEWNLAVGQALMRDIAHFEVALRNAYDITISEDWQGGAHWLLDGQSPVVTPMWHTKKKAGITQFVDGNAANRHVVAQAIARSGGKKATPGKVIAALSLGFWATLTKASYEKVLWVPYLHHAYPEGSDRATIDQGIATIVRVRNRIAHHEPLFDRPSWPLQQPQLVVDKVHELLAMIAPDLATHVSSTSCVNSVIAARP